MIQKKAQLCIVGGAGGGLSAAVKAKQLGIQDVILIDKNKSFGGCSRGAAGFFAVNSPVQQRMGYHYNPDEVYKKLMAVLNWNCDAKLVRNWIGGSGETVRWLESMGMQFDSVMPGNGLAHETMHTYHWNRGSGYKTGMLVVNTLLAKCKELGVEMYTSTRAQHLMTDEDNKVIGVQAINGTGEEVQIMADAVILSTGSISSNKELIKRFYHGEDYADIKIMANVPHNTGDGLIMAEEIGAAAGQISTLFIGPHNHFPNASEITCGFLRRAYPIRVNINGERVQDEAGVCTSDFGWFMGVNIDRQPGKVIYGLMDTSMLEYQRQYDREPETAMEELVEYYGNIKDHASTAIGGDAAYAPGKWMDDFESEAQKEMDAGRAMIADNWDDIADYIGCDRDVLKHTISEYNRFCKNGYDEDFLKDPRFMRPLVQPPFYCLRGPSGIDTCIGGLSIDSHQRVLNKAGRPIKGLYAAGVLTSGWCAHNYAYFGAELSYTLFSGRSASENALQDVRK